MKHVFLLLAALALAGLAPGSASAACYADYKAKKEQPLRLHYGVMQVDASPCARTAAVTQDVETRLGAGGWTLLQVQSVFDESGLDARKKDAGQYFLRF